MRPVTQMFRHEKRRVWVLAGKGPSFEKRATVPLAEFPVLGLNHVCLLHPVDVALFTDLDAFMDCSQTLARSKTKVIMPWFPHVKNKPGKRNLLCLEEDLPNLGEIADGDRLFGFNSSQDRRHATGLPTHRVKFFSAVVALDILATHIADTVYTIGIDGGTKYAEGFDTKNLLKNGRSSFDAQFAEMEKIAARYSISCVPLLESFP